MEKENKATEQNQQLVSHPFSPSKTFLILIVIILFAAVGTGAYFLGIKNAQPISQPQVVPPVVSHVTLIPTSNPIDTWTIFSSPDLHFTIKYPADTLKIRDAYATEKAIYVNPNKVTQINQVRYYIYFAGWDNPKKLPIDQLVSSNLTPIHFTRSNINQYVAYTTTDLPSQSGSLCNFITSDESRYVSACLSPYNKLLPTQAVDVMQKQNANLNLYNQILSTFAFTPASPQGGNQNSVITPTCMPRPACLDATPRCLLPEPASGWCQTSTSASQ